MPASRAFYATNAANATPPDLNTHPTSDSDCLLVVEKPVHTHKSRKSTTPSRKPRVSKSRSEPSRRSSHAKGPKRDVMKSKKAIKRKGSRSASSSPAAKVRRKTVHKTRLVQKSNRISACPFAPRALGRKKTRPQLRASKRPTKKQTKPVVNRKIIDKSSVVKVNVCPFAKRIGKASSKRKSSEKLKAVTPKRRRSWSSKRAQSLTPKQVSSTQKKKRTSTPKRSVAIRSKRKSPSKKATPGGRKSLGSCSGRSSCTLKPRPVVTAWKERLRPRPLRSARFSCYRSDCMEKNAYAASIPTTRKQAPELKSPKAPKSRKQITKSQKPMGGKNRNNMFLKHQKRMDPKLWFDTTEDQPAPTESHAMSYAV
ncbi:unnamed protein product, partial [Echinostoma caproni]|uniref:Neurofilament triplet H1-like protein n=1 Tax=Echinostoma caproni TaxID=27848 RepID=A0A183BE88_9TREM